MILLVVPKETSSDGQGHVRTEVGFGAEGFITDATTGQFRDEAIPFFRQRDYGDGIELMTLRIAQRFANEFNFQVDSSFQAPVRRPQPRACATRRRNSSLRLSVHSVRDSLRVGRRTSVAADVCRSSFRWVDSAAAGAAAGAAADSAAVAGLVAVAAGSAVSVVEAGSAAAALADTGDPWRE